MIAGICLGPACKKARLPDQKAQRAETEKKLDQKNILQINTKFYSNADLKEFIQLQYSGTQEDTKDSRFLSRLFNRFVEQQFIFQEAEKANMTVNDEELAAYMKNLTGTEVDIKSQQVRKMVLLQKYLTENVYGALEVSRTEIERYYQDHKEEFKRDERIFLYQILVSDKEKAIQLRSEALNAPSRFEQIAKRDSQSVEKNEGGKMGFFEKGQLPIELENVVFSLKVGQISPVIESPYGFHIFKVTKRQYARQRYLDQVKSEIEEKLYSEKMNQQYQEFINRMQRENQIQMWKENLYFPYQEISSLENANEM